MVFECRFGCVSAGFALSSAGLGGLSAGLSRGRGREWLGKALQAAPRWVLIFVAWCPSVFAHFHRCRLRLLLLLLLHLFVSSWGSLPEGRNPPRGSQKKLASQRNSGILHGSFRGFCRVHMKILQRFPPNNPMLVTLENYWIFLPRRLCLCLLFGERPKMIVPS